MSQITEKLILTIWIGAIWSIGYIVVPVLFNMLDKQVAGNVAGQLFTILNYLGLFSSLFLLATLLLRQGFDSHYWQFWALVSMLLIILVSLFLLQPEMQALKLRGLEGEVAARFSSLHKISSALFVINSLLGLVLVIFGLDKRIQAQ